MIIAITGTPGTGKTEVAKALAKRLNYKIIFLNELAEQKNLYAGYDESRKAKVVDIERLREETGRLLEENMILESHYSHDMPCDSIVVLRASPEELRERGRAKAWPKMKIEENVQSEIMEVILSEALETGKRVFVFDTSGKKPLEVAREVIKKLGLKKA